MNWGFIEKSWRAGNYSVQITPDGEFMVFAPNTSSVHPDLKSAKAWCEEDLRMGKAIQWIDKLPGSGRRGDIQLSLTLQDDGHWTYSKCGELTKNVSYETAIALLLRDYLDLGRHRQEMVKAVHPLVQFDTNGQVMPEDAFAKMNKIIDTEQQT